VSAVRVAKKGIRDVKLVSLELDFLRLSWFSLGLRGDVAQDTEKVG
jgi:hypothetical protein